MSSICNYGVYGAHLAAIEATGPRPVGWEGHRKTIRPDRLSFRRRGTSELIEAKSSLRCKRPGSSFGVATALNRRFGASDTRAGNRNGSFSAPVFGSEIMLTDESEGWHRVDVSYLFFYWLRKISKSWLPI